MKRLFWIILGFVFLAGGFLFPVSSKDLQGSRPKHRQPVEDLGYVGELAFLDGNVNAQRYQSSSWLKAYQNMPDYLFDKIKTGEKSRAALEFRDGTQVGINKDTVVFIDTETSVKDVTKRTLLKRVVLKIGTIWCKVTRQEADESFTVETQGGVLGIRGTEFVVTTDGTDEMIVYVLDGTVLGGIDKDHLTEVIPKGKKVVIKNGKIVSEEDIDAADVYLLFPNLDPGIDIRNFLLCESVLIGSSPRLQLPDSLASRTGSFSPQKALFFKEKRDGYSESPSANFLEKLRFPEPLLQPSLAAPSGLVSTYAPVFSWSEVRGAFQYAVVITTAPPSNGNAQGSLAWATRVKKTSMTYPVSAPMLEPNATYYWSVEALDENGLQVGRRSAWSSFTMASADVLQKQVLYPVPSFPVDQAIEDQLPVFSFKQVPGASGYQVLISSQLKENQIDQSHLVAVLNSNGTSAAYDLKSRPLEAGKNYYWAVRSLDENGRVFTYLSPPVSFRLSSRPEKMGPRPVFPVQPVPLEPSLHFEWRNWLPDITGYHLVVSRDPDLKDPVLEQDTEKPWFDWNEAQSRLVEGNIYYWQVSTITLKSDAEVKGPVASFATLTFR